MNHHNISTAHPHVACQGPYEPLTSYETKALMDQRGFDNRWVLLDVRMAIEFLECRIPGAKLIPLDRLPHSYDSLDRAKSYLIYARKEQDACEACKLLADAGFQTAYLTGGIVEWMQQRYPITCG